jgi:hypothetical protein
MNHVRRTLLALVCAPAVLAQSGPQGAPISRGEVLVLGVYHMSNPGRDLANTDAGDVLSPRRQAEMAELISVLKRFRPTKVAVEAPFYEDATAQRYADYVAGKVQLNRNEVQQIGFRLARDLGHTTIHSVDADGEFPFLRVEDFARSRGRAALLDSLTAETRNRAKVMTAFIASHTILESLAHLNAPEQVAADMGWHYRLAHLSDPWNWAGPDLIADYYRRNMRIYGNIIGLTGPNERVLVIYGAGHLPWLRQIFGADPTVRLRSLSDFQR